MALATVGILKMAINVSTDATFTDLRYEQLLDAADAAVKHYTGRDLEQTTYPGAARHGQGDGGYYSGSGRRELLLRQFPVTTLTSVYLDNTAYFGQGTNPFAAATLLTAGTDYVLDLDGYLGSAACSLTGTVLRLGAGPGSPAGWWLPGDQTFGPATGSLSQPYRYPFWPKAQGNIKVAYTAGYPANAVPADLVQAVCQLAAWLARNAPQGGQFLQHEKLGEYDYQFAQLALGARPELGSTRSLLSKYKRVNL